MWKLKVAFLAHEDSLQEGNEIEEQQWVQVPITGQQPKKLAHHQGILQESLDQYIIYGGMIGLDSSDVIYVVDLKNMNFTAISSSQQKEKSDKALPGPRDAFCFVTVATTTTTKVKPMYLIGGFKNGMKMNDIYKLHYENQTFEWEFLDIKQKLKPEVRSSFGACVQIDPHGKEHIFIFGGSGDNNAKYNDIWECDGTHWTLHKPQTKEDGLPLEKSGLTLNIYQNRYLLIFGGIHEVTYEMNDLRVFDL